jgi:predicted CxxxxCH...CXXCH cytochrome family protein
MKKILSYYLPVITIIMTFVYGCSKIDNNATVAPDFGFHGTGWINPASDNFHGDVISSANWDMGGCKSCHGNDYNGGSAGTSCYNCHPQGPEGCNTCHGSPQYTWPPKALSGNTLSTQTGVGAHDVHMSPDSSKRISAGVACSECHKPVTSFSDTNHIYNDSLNIARVIFGTLAKTRWGSGVTPNPVWNRTTQTCSTAYCHGYFRNGNLTNTPTFIDPNSGRCGTCHGNPSTGDPRPGGNHPDEDDCNECHAAVINSSGQFINKSLHINGKINFHEE